MSIPLNSAVHIYEAPTHKFVTTSATGTNPSTAMTIATSGSVGIGTTSPQTNLDVRGNALISGTLTTSNLNVLGANTVINGLETVSSNVTVNNIAGFGPALKITQTGTGANYPIADFYDNDVSTTIPALRIADGGYVGIGTATPLNPLHVVGNALVTGTLTQTGHVGIGTVPSNTYSLDVSGGVNVSGTITTGNSCSLKYWTVSGTTPSTAGVGNYTLPSGYIFANTVACYGGYNSSGYFFPFNNTHFTYSGDIAFNAEFWISGAGVSIRIQSGATYAFSAPFTIIIVTSA